MTREGMLKSIIMILVIVLYGAKGNEGFSQQLFASVNEEVAFDGFDLVTYFDHSPQIGNKKISYEYNGLKLIFANQSNRNEFASNPEKYLPEYGGWCATAMITGKCVRPDFTRYKIQDDRLLFFEVKAFFNGYTQWEKDAEYHSVIAAAQFRKVKASLNESTETEYLVD